MFQHPIPFQIGWFSWVQRLRFGQVNTPPKMNGGSASPKNYPTWNPESHRKPPKPPWFWGQNVNFPGSGSFVEWLLIETTFFFCGVGTEKPRGHPAICGRGKMDGIGARVCILKMKDKLDPVAFRTKIWVCIITPWKIKGVGRSLKTTGKFTIKKTSKNEGFGVPWNYIYIYIYLDLLGM